jgi:Pyruvate/2-oxoacid:ferredoxin oxidoreductase delta subunit
MTISYNMLRIAALAALVSTAACSSKKDDTTPAPAAPTSISWTLDGANVTGTVTSAVLSRDTVKVLVTNGSNRIRIAIPHRAGTMRLSDCTQCSQYAPEATVSYSTGNGTRVFTPYAGSMTVSNSTSTNTTGTFNVSSIANDGTADRKILTNGVFSFNY